MEAIRKMEPAWVKVNGRNFALVEYKDAKGELRPIRHKGQSDPRVDDKVL